MSMCNNVNIIVQFHLTIIVPQLINIPKLALPAEVPTTTVTATGSVVLRQSLTLSCNVTILERLVVSPGINYNITWIKMDSVGEQVIGRDITIPTVQTVNGITTTTTITLASLSYGDRGLYICEARLNFTATFDGGYDSDTYDITFDCELYI